MWFSSRGTRSWAPQRGHWRREESPSPGVESPDRSQPFTEEGWWLIEPAVGVPPSGGPHDPFEPFAALLDRDVCVLPRTHHQHPPQLPARPRRPRRPRRDRTPGSGPGAADEGGAGGREAAVDADGVSGVARTHLDREEPQRVRTDREDLQMEEHQRLAQLATIPL